MELSPSAPDVAYYLCGEPAPDGAPDTFTRAKIDRSFAVMAHSSEGVVAVVDVNNFNLDPLEYDVTTFDGVVPFLRYEDAGDNGGGIVEVNFRTSYDRGGVNIEDDVDGGASQFLMEITGASAHDFTVRARDDSYGASPEIKAFSGNDGGQYVSLIGYTTAFGITRIKLWRVAGSLPPPPPSNFWTSFIGSREII